MVGRKLIWILLLTACTNNSTEPELPIVALQADTVTLEDTHIWFRILGTSSTPQNLAIGWRIEVETNNFLWLPKEDILFGEQHFIHADTATVWGSIPRAYNIELESYLIDEQNDTIFTFFNYTAPICENPLEPTLVCNIR